MRTRTKLLCLLLCLLMITPLLVACNKNGKPVYVVKGGESDYVIIYSRTSAEEKQIATDLRNAIEEKTGVKLKLEADSFSDKPNQILVGDTNRDATADVLGTIREKDFAIAYREGRIVIAGGTTAATKRAVEYFIENNVSEKKARVTVYTKDYIGEYGYMLGDLTVDGTPLTDYTIVYPADAPKTDKVVYYAAINLQDYFLNNAGIKLNVKSDAAGETANEILVGKTNRTASQSVQSIALAEDEYLLCKNGSKIVMMGNSLMVAAAAGAFVNDCFVPTGANQAVNATVTTTPTPAKFSFKKATNAILMVGDGMGPNHIIAGVEAGKINLAQNAAADKCADMFVADLMPYKAMCTTASQSVLEGLAQFTDSAAAATALATGYKTYNYYVGTDKNGTKLTSLRDLANSKGAKTAILTTAAITDATPAAFLAHATDRYDSTLQAQVDKLIADGKVTFAEGDTNDLSKVNEGDLLGRIRQGLAIASEGNSTFFSMIEEAHIDKFSHKVQSQVAQLYDVQNSVLCYNEAIAYVIAFVMMNPDTALIVTADHECGKLTIDETTGIMKYDFLSNDHTNTDVPVWGMGYGVEELLAGKTTIDNTDIPKFIATIYGEANFGQQ